jgi:phenylacetate-CoA ligase
LIREYEATVIAGLPTTLISLASEVANLTWVRLILFAGEPLQSDQRAYLLKAFPNAQIRSIGYASTDAGLLGYCDLHCGPNEFRCYGRETVFEIVDEVTGEPVHERGEEGRAVVTDVKRKLMPVIRYPVGDRAQWLEEEGSPARKFRLLGRSEESARVASITIHVEEIQAILGGFSDHLGTLQFQLVVVHQDARDGLVVRIACEMNDEAKRTCSHHCIQAIYHARPLYREFVGQKKVLPIEIEWRALNGLEINPRTGKLKRVIDLRNR